MADAAKTLRQYTSRPISRGACWERSCKFALQVRLCWSAELSMCVGSVQDPAQADKLTKIQRDLDETKVILHKTIESMLERGEKLDSLVDKSSDLSMASQMFYKQARKTNSCCKMM